MAVLCAPGKRRYKRQVTSFCSDQPWMGVAAEWSFLDAVKWTSHFTVYLPWLVTCASEELGAGLSIKWTHSLYYVIAPQILSLYPFGKNV